MPKKLKKSRKKRHGSTRPWRRLTSTSNIQGISLSKRQPTAIFLAITARDNKSSRTWTGHCSRKLLKKLLIMVPDLSPYTSSVNPSFGRTYWTESTSSSRPIDVTWSFSPQTELTSIVSPGISSDSGWTKSSGRGGGKRSSKKKHSLDSKIPLFGIGGPVLGSASSKKSRRKKKLKGGRSGRRSK